MRPHWRYLTVRLQLNQLMDEFCGEFGYDRPIRLDCSSRLKRAWGTANCTDSVITLSSYLDPSEVEDTLRHEFAHLMVGPKVKAHGKEWQAAARRVGAVPDAYSPGSMRWTPYHLMGRRQFQY